MGGAAVMPKTLTKPRRRKQVHVSRQDRGRRMSLDDFDTAEAPEGVVLELHNGVIEAIDFPELPEIRQRLAIRDQLIFYGVNHRDVVVAVATQLESKVVIKSMESECHPEISVYLTPAPKLDAPWSVWIPGIVVEVVSQASVKRDYEIKPAEYLAFGIQEYWIVDGLRKTMTFKSRRRGQWKTTVCKPAQKFTTPLLPEFVLDLKQVFAAAK
jgi:Uma2 family endonuclease